MERLIYHVDVNNAYLSWEATEQLNNGADLDIRTIPAIIGGDTSKRRGVVLAKSMPAKACGIRTGEPVKDALKKCPALKSFPPDFSLYRKYSKAFIAILKKYSPVVEQVSVDEAYLDMSGLHYFYSRPTEAAEKIKKEIRETLGFTVNIGVSSNKLLAKMASDFDKPDKIHTLFLSEIQEKMWPLPIRRLYFSGAAAEKQLNALGIQTIGDLARSNPLFLQSHLKSKGVVLWNYANGIDDTPVKKEPDKPKGYGNSITLSKDVTKYEEAEKILFHLSETVAARLRKDGIFARTIEVEIKDNGFCKKSHQMALDDSTNATNVIYDVSCKLFREAWNGNPIRLLGVRCTKLTEEKMEQITLEQFSKTKNLEDGSQKNRELKKIEAKNRESKKIEAKNRIKQSKQSEIKQTEKQKSRELEITEKKMDKKTREKMERLDLALDKIREKYGEDAVGRAGFFFLEK